MNFLLAEAGMFQFGMWDMAVFVLFILAVIIISTLKSKSAGESSEDYFLAGRGLSWWLIGFSLIAANISAEQFVGMAGNAAQCTGLAIASYEWIAAITLVLVGFLFLPKFLKCGIYTIPEFLEYRYNKASRSIMSVLMMVILVGVTLAAVISAGALVIDTLFHGWTVMYLNIEINLVTASWFIGILAAAYVFIGGLQACAWADLLQGSALIIGGAIVMFFAFGAFEETKIEDMNATPQFLRPAAYQAGDDANMFSDVTQDTPVLEKFQSINADKLHMLRPLSDPNIVWTTLLFGIWIPNLYYWGLNQYIMQRTLGSRSLAEGQKGIVFAAGMKLLIPFIVVIPGILAFNIFSSDMKAEGGKFNAPQLALLERLQEGKPEATDNTGTFFKFDKEFAYLEPAVAVELVNFNMNQLPTDVRGDYASRLAESRKAVEEENTKNKVEMESPMVEALAVHGVNQALLDSKPAEAPVATELVGYKYDAAFPLLLRNLNFPLGVMGFVLAALFGAIMSSLASMLNAASTIFTMDIYREYLNKHSSSRNQVFVGRVCVVIFAIIACIVAPIISDPKFGGIFKYIQEFQGYLSPGVLVVFLYGLISRRVPGFAGGLTILLSPVVYGALKFVPWKSFDCMWMQQMNNFLNQMALTFVVLWIFMFLMNMLFPRKELKELPQNTTMDMTSSRGAAICGTIVVLITVALYVYFW